MKRFPKLNNSAYHILQLNSFLAKKTLEFPATTSSILDFKMNISLCQTTSSYHVFSPRAFSDKKGSTEHSCQDQYTQRYLFLKIYFTLGLCTWRKKEGCWCHHQISRSTNWQIIIATILHNECCLLFLWVIPRLFGTP